MKIRVIVIISFFFAIIAKPLFGLEIDKEINKLKSSDRTEVISSIRNLARMENVKAEFAIINELKSTKDNYIKIQIIEALTMYRSTTAIESIIATLDDKNAYVRQSAMINLGYFGDNERIAQAIATSLQNEKDESVKSSAINTLAHNKNKKSAIVLSSLINREKNTTLRKAAAKGLAKINTAESKIELKKYISDKDIELRKEIKELLRKLK